MSLLGLSLVMVIQDPVMSLMGFIMAPPALFFLRKLIRRVRNIARMQFTGGTRIIETMQEALQGMRMVKAFAPGRRDAAPAGKERRRGRARVQQDGARRPTAPSPLMETLGGFAIALATIYGGYRGDRDRRDAGRVRVVSGRISAGL